jgi:amino acid adenylation domain-containing protein
MMHGSFSAIDVMRELALRRGPAQALMPFVFTSTLGVADHLARLSFDFGAYAGGISQTPQVWLDNQVVQCDGALLVNWDVADGVFRDGVIDAMFEAYRDILRWLSTSGADWNEAMPSPFPAPQRAVRAAVNDTAAPEYLGLTLHAGFFARAAEQPNRPAVLAGVGGEAVEWSYGELADRVRRVAAWLQAQGVTPGDTVVVSLPKSVDQIAAILGVLAAGAAYVPVAVDQPALRRSRIVATALPRALLDEHAMRAALGRSAPGLGPTFPESPDALAYIMYTSGSTGEPKGVEITHGAAMSTIAALNARYAIGPGDRGLAVSSLEFDLSVYDIFGLLSAGGAVVVPDESMRRDAAAWGALVERWGVTFWNSVPALFEMLLEGARPRELRTIRLVFVSGDWVRADLMRRAMQQLPACNLVALGGATEASIWSNALDVGEIRHGWNAIPYGYPLQNACFRVVDERERDCPDWVPGELWIGGAGLARGYRGQPELTAERFVVRDGTAWYRTGDLGCYSPQGILQFLGRKDQQVKLNGYRIELGDVEAALRTAPHVLHAAAAIYHTARPHLGAAVVLSSGHGDDNQLAQLRTHLAHRLPGHMRPEHIVFLSQLPLSSNAKVDRRKLATLLAEDAAARCHVGESPRRGTEEMLASLWSDVIGCATVKPDDNFFALGGDSLLATRLVRLVAERLGLSLPLASIFTSATLADLAQAVDEALGDSETGAIT